ncbi:hypothetical protein PUN28_002846 [Cardiocondyla obscurior]|uniref:Uncharacterized protein n=1 Tax=Cardiocondyla obscurior TaxID=286306 RepID=A0AAW2GWB9_9HYME
MFSQKSAVISLREHYALPVRSEKCSDRRLTRERRATKKLVCLANSAVERALRWSAHNSKQVHSEKCLDIQLIELDFILNELTLRPNYKCAINTIIAVSLLDGPTNRENKRITDSPKIYVSLVSLTCRDSRKFLYYRFLSLRNVTPLELYSSLLVLTDRSTISFHNRNTYIYIFVSNKAEFFNLVDAFTWRKRTQFKSIYTHVRLHSIISARQFITTTIFNIFLAPIETLYIILFFFYNIYKSTFYFMNIQTNYQYSKISNEAGNNV